mgnify:CR=1 FL=1
MVDYNLICFYSNYSKQSKRLKNLINNKLIIDFISIDHPDVRKYIENDKKLNINTVPCILIMKDNGIIEKFEGEKSFELCKILIKEKEKLEDKKKPKKISFNYDKKIQSRIQPQQIKSQQMPPQQVQQPIQSRMPPQQDQQPIQSRMPPQQIQQPIQSIMPQQQDQQPIQSRMPPQQIQQPIQSRMPPQQIQQPIQSIMPPQQIQQPIQSQHKSSQMLNNEQTHKSQILQQDRNESFIHMQQSIKNQLNNQQPKTVNHPNNLNDLQKLTANDIEKQRQNLVFDKDPNLNENMNLKVHQMKMKNSINKPEVKKNPIKSNNNIMQKAKLLQRQSKENLF